MYKSLKVNEKQAQWVPISTRDNKASGDSPTVAKKDMAICSSTLVSAHEPESLLSLHPKFSLLNYTHKLYMSICRTRIYNYSYLFYGCVIGCTLDKERLTLNFGHRKPRHLTPAGHAPTGVSV